MQKNGIGPILALKTIIMFEKLQAPMVDVVWLSSK